MALLRLLLPILPYYLITVLIETPVLVVGLSRRHSMSDRLLAGFWLNLCSYPVVAIVIPSLLAGCPRFVWLAVGETFAPLAECGLFWSVWGSRDELGRRSMWRDFGAIVAANLLSFGMGELLLWAGVLS